MWEILKSWRKESKNDAKTPKKDDAGGSPVHRNFSTSVNFKDLTFSLEQHDDDDEEHGSVDSTLAQAHSEATTAIPSPRHTTKLKRLERNKLIIIMVGLPGRGKTFLCNKLVCYLNWLGHDTKLFNVGSYRRLQKDQGEVQDASFFDKNNVAGLEARRKALEAALDDLKAYLASEAGQVAIFDATNTTNERRQHLIDEFHGKFQYLFIESICTDEQVLEQNYRYKMKYSPDYRGMDEDQALSDFKDRIRKYEEVYEPLNDRSRHYIKLIDMVTGRGHMDINRISGYIPGKIVFFLMQVCKAGMAQERKIWLTRHGESQFNLHGKIGGNAGLSDLGQEYARALPDKLLARLPTSHPGAVPVSVWTSTLRRTIETAENIMFPKLRWKALDEIHAGSCDGLTYEEIAERFPEEYEARSRDKLRYRYPAGESYLDVIQRLEPVIIELERERECVCVVAHQAVLRVIYGYFTAAPLAEIPTLEIPLHKLIELKPRPDGTMQVEILPVTEDPGTGAHPSLPPVNHPEHNKRLSSQHARVGSLACDIPSRADSSNGAAPCDSAPSFADASFMAAMASTSAPTAPSPLGQGASPPLVFPSLPGPLRVLSPVRCLPFNDMEAMGNVPLPGHGIAGSGPTAPTQVAGVPQPGPYMDGSGGGAGDADADTEEMEGVCRESTLHVLDPGSDSSAAPTPANSIASAAPSLAATPHASAGGAV